ncbi:hypothetical protein RRG08_023306 [Elysia crispata]|uniref:Uncharacterized protein n=1 Tax=Elysia crispata TaxID=231223 RepID=A0AAE1BC42_9GAST|nr:hypothetical protein RRG08_023306 [Elysia crispata]
MSGRVSCHLGLSALAGTSTRGTCRLYILIHMYMAVGHSCGPRFLWFVASMSGRVSCHLGLSALAGTSTRGTCRLYILIHTCIWPWDTAVGRDFCGLSLACLAGCLVISGCLP